MALSDVFNASKIKEENEQLKKLMTPEMKNAINLQNYISELNKQIQTLQTQSNSLSSEINKKQSELNSTNEKIRQLNAQLFDVQDSIYLQDFGLYKPKYALCNSDAYKDRLSAIRQEQKNMIKNGIATTGNANWTVNGSKTQGSKMVHDMQKLLLRAFNSECDELINKVKYNNLDSAKNVSTLHVRLFQNSVQLWEYQ